ncbi:MAG: pyridoxal phosphate-dependent aminotransferase [Desulfobacteraceae bacterium]|jgi:aspartate aminotransferase
MPIAERMVSMVEGSSMIRKMFEEGARLKAKYGQDKVFDFSLGNPDVPPPPEFKQALIDIIQDPATSHGYMPNPGYPHVRQTVSDFLKGEYGVEIPPDLIIMTVGAAGALNDALTALINPGEEILVPSPYFVGYNQYAFNAQGVITTAETDAEFRLDLGAMEKAITEKTRVVLINSPNNPTGVVYTVDELKGLGEVMERASARFGKRIYLISDEPYRKIAYDVEVPSVFQAYPHTLLITSYSKELSLAGERIGYLAVHPDAEDAGTVAAAAAVSNTMLYVNAPSLFQLAIARVMGVSVDVSIYRKRRDALCDGLRKAGYEFVEPEGAFYLFPKSPMEDDAEFCRLLMDELILVVPGRGFGRGGHFRISYAVPDQAISGAMEGFQRALEKVR